jgi:hypothetical protein
MTMVTEYDWETNTFTHHGENGTRAAWREAVAEIAAKAKETLPQCNGRVDKAVAIVLNGDVELLEGGKAKVASQSNGTTQYFVVNGTCECKDFPKAPSGWCKHRIAAGMQKRAQALVQRKLNGVTNGQAEPPSQPEPAHQPTAPAVPNAPLPEAPASCNVYVTLAGRKVQVTLRDSDEQRMLARLDALLQRFPVEAEPDSEPAQPEGWCAKHGVQMTQNHKDGRSWWSHKTAAGWCKGR